MALSGLPALLYASMETALSKTVFHVLRHTCLTKRYDVNQYNCRGANCQ